MAKTSIFKTDEGKKEILSFYENLLKGWFQPSKQHFIETSFGNTFVIESGIGHSNAVLLLHGSGSNLGMWKGDVQELSKNYHVIAVDIIGECGKSSEHRPSFKNDNYVEWLSELIGKLNLNKVSLVANSLGGWIAMNFAIKYPSKTQKLVLMATAGIVQVKPQTIVWIIITSFFGSWGFNKLNKMVYGNLNIDDVVLEFASLIKDNFKPRTDVLPVLSDRSLNKIIVPTFFIGGENDCFYNSQKTASRLKSNLENVQCSVLDDTGHVIINQTNRIIQFLNS